MPQLCGIVDNQVPLGALGSTWGHLGALGGTWGHLLCPAGLLVENDRVVVA